MAEGRQHCRWFTKTEIPDHGDLLVRAAVAPIRGQVCDKEHRDKAKERSPALVKRGAQYRETDRAIAKGQQIMETLFYTRSIWCNCAKPEELH